MIKCLKAFWKQLFCSHRKEACWQIMNIAWDGEVTVKCSKCGATKERMM